MTFGQQPQGNNANGFNGQPYGQNQYNPNQNPYGQNQYQYTPQNMYAQGAPAATIPAQATYSYERAEHASVTRAYGEMTIGLLVTAAVAILPSHRCLHRAHPVAWRHWRLGAVRRRNRDRHLSWRPH